MNFDSLRNDLLERFEDWLHEFWCDRSRDDQPLKTRHGEGDDFGVSGGRSEEDGSVERLRCGRGFSSQLEERLVLVELEELVRFLRCFAHVRVSTPGLLAQREVVVHEQRERRHRARTRRRERCNSNSRVASYSGLNRRFVLIRVRLTRCELYDSNGGRFV